MDAGRLALGDVAAQGGVAGQRVALRGRKQLAAGVLGDLPSEVLRLEQDALELGRASDQGDAQAPEPPLADLARGQAEEGVAARDDADVDQGDVGERAQPPLGPGPPELLDLGGVEVVPGPLLPVVAERRGECRVPHDVARRRQLGRVAVLDGAHPRGALAALAEQHDDLLEHTVEHQVPEAGDGELDEPVDQMLPELCRVADLEQLGREHQRHPAAGAQRLHGATVNGTHALVSRVGRSPASRMRAKARALLCSVQLPKRM